jgi:hypothetical protein
MKKPGHLLKLGDESWPALPLAEWSDTYATLHMWTQIAGKVRMKLAPRLNHWWHVPLYVDARGLTTSLIPLGNQGFAIRFDFLDHRLVMETSSGGRRGLLLKPRSVAEFYRLFMYLLDELGICVKIDPVPSEVRDPIPFDQDTVHASYDPEYAQRFWRILVAAANVFQEFRSRFVGKCSPVHFFWGSFDLAVTRFSGRPAPERPGADAITREAYSHEVSSAGWWPGGETLVGPSVPGAAFYSYMAPAPAGLAEQKILPPAAYYDKTLGEFLLRYDDMREQASPSSVLLDFLQSTYETGAGLARWDRAALEQPEPWLKQGEEHAA